MSEGRDVLVLIDGTSCAWTTGTNIRRLAEIADQVGLKRQYEEGTATITNTKLLDKVLAPNLEPAAYNVYKLIQALDLCSSDRLFLVGYSRGAITARILAMAIVSPGALRTVVGNIPIEKSISAQVQFLGLIDPVAGWPRATSRAVRDHNAILERRIRNYVELIALNDRRTTFRSDSYSADKNVIKSVQHAPSGTVHQTKADRDADINAQFVRRSRKCIWLPGGHSDLGRQGGCEVIGTHALLTVIEEALISGLIDERQQTLQRSDVQRLLEFADFQHLPTASKVHGWFEKAKHAIPFGKRNRKVRQGLTVPNFKHSLCALDYVHQRKNYQRVGDLPEYPDYPAVRNCISK